ncbi:MAG: hypothetical protein N5P05_002221 [Chroococcopsis gigantea SAG 12.99]|jgi:fatty acid desaturase|nr:hypothetical protein [Chroococcopsis gigantea SAG 12.99]
MTTIANPVNQLLSVQQLNALNSRNNKAGALRLLGHFAIMGASGYLWGTNLDRWPLALPFLIVYGFSFASMFATMHECVHRTAFSNNLTNDVVAWIAAVLSFYNSTFYRRYHKWHHRYTQIPDKDPELEDPKPTNSREYVREIIGWNWWRGKLRFHFLAATGLLPELPYISKSARSEVIRSVRLQLLVYSIAIGISVVVGQPWFLLYWLLPLVVGQPILRMILLSEHGGCSHDDNYLTNTRTTHTLWPLRFLMWNMPYHAEHHLYPSIPFHALPTAHDLLSSHFSHVDRGYIEVNRQIVSSFHP